ncbi:MAG: hypothetical protein JO266_21300 [Acidobacteria bacterium]|nr:hypothetical protein [Acidobacteriota bacterium]
MHRREEKGKKITRELFGWEEEGKRKIEAYEAIDKAGKKYRFLHMTISPDPKREDTRRDLDLKEMIQKTMLTLQGQFTDEDIYFFASVHEGHTDKRHVNMLVLVPARLNREQLVLLRQSATDNANAQRERLDQDLGVSTEKSPVQTRMWNASRGAARSKQVSARADAGSWDPRCPVCLTPLERSGRFLKCDNCELLLSRSHGIGFEMRYIGEELSLDLDEEEQRKEASAL